MALKKTKLKSASEFVQGKTTRTSAKQKFGAYKDLALTYIRTLRNPASQSAFFVKGYEVTPTGKKPNAVNIPELLAIVGTAAKLGKDVRIVVSGQGDAAQLEFSFVDQSPNVPSELFA